MFFPTHPSAYTVWLCKDPIDFRKGINTLGILVEQVLGKNPFEPGLFVFTHRSHKKIKILYWDRNGFCLWQKRLEKDIFHWPKHVSQDPGFAISPQQLYWLLDGQHLRFWKPHAALKYEKLC